MGKGHNQIIATPEALAAALVSACEEFTDDVKQELEQGIIKIGEEAVDEVKKLAPVYKGKKQNRRVTRKGESKNRTKGTYKRNWTYRVDKERGKIIVTVHVKGGDYRLTHLLEYGHASKGGGRAKAIPHISIVNENAEKKVDKLLEEIANGTN